MMDLVSSQPAISSALPFWRQLRWQFILSFVLVAVVPVVIVASVTNTLTRAQAQNQVFRQLESVADLKRDQIVSWINDNEAALRLLTSGPVSDRLVGFLRTTTPTQAEQDQVNALLRAAMASADTAGRSQIQFRNLFLYTPD